MKNFTLLFLLLLSTVFAVKTTNAQTLPEPIAHYTFDYDASDEKGLYDGTLEGDAVIDEDFERGSVLSLTETGYVSISPELANVLEDFSFTAWVNFGGTVQWAGLIGMGKSESKTFPYWDFHIRGNSKTMSFYSSAEVVWPSDGCSKVVDNFVFPDPSEWVHIAFCFTHNTDALVYVNAELQTTSDWREIQDFHVSPSMLEAEIVTIGRDAFNQGTLTNTKIDDFRFFDIPLTEDEVIAIFEDDGEPNAVKNMKLNNNLHIVQNYPNPFSNETTIEYEISAGSQVMLSVHNVYGQEIAVLANGFKNAGTHFESFNGANLPGGVYFYRLDSNGQTTTHKMIIVK